MAESQEAGGGGATQAAGELAARQRRLQSYLPSKVVDAFRDAGVTRDLYPWQARPAAAFGQMARRARLYDGKFLDKAITADQQSHTGLASRGTAPNCA